MRPRRILIPLGVALLGIWAASTTLSPASESAKFTAAEYPAFPLVQISGWSFTAFGAEGTCANTEYPGATLTGPTTTISNVLHSTNCTVSGPFGSNLPATTTTNSCFYEAHLGSTVGKEEYAATADLKCEKPGDVGEVHIYANHNALTSGTALCTLTIPPQNGKQGLRFTVNKGEINDVKMTASISGIELVQHRNSFLCPGSGSTPSGEATLHIASVTIQATNSSKKLIHGDIG